jgi:FkbH-like protein
VKITEALKALQGAPQQGEVYRVFLACGFTPLHLETLLAAHLQRHLPDRRVTVAAGLYGDIAGSLEGLQTAAAHGVAVALEWQDADPRLGYRGAGAWGLQSLADIETTVRAAWSRIAAAMENIPSGIPVAVSLPTLPLPPIFHTPGWQMADAELALEREMWEFAARIARRQGLLLANPHRLSEESPAAARYDLKSDLAAGLPCTIPHADAVAAVLARLLAPPPPKKGLITDLDDTLWFGLVGETGPEQVSWDLASHHQLHGLYQKLLASLAEEGVLVGIASKNDPAVARQALGRQDMLLPLERVFPVEASWDAKSAAVERILRVWNIGADSVVFVDDSPMELAEVAAAHPGLLCLPFPKDDPAAGFRLLRQLRDLFGKPRLSIEDSYRLKSIRQGAGFRQFDGAASAAEAFLAQAEATVTMDFDLTRDDPRVLELVNKTNQFNLNGVRYTEADWRRNLEREGACLAVVGYRDKFGPLGKIAAMQGRRDRDTVTLDVWVMSCRAFSRRIEYQCLRQLFARSGARRIAFNFQPTARNGPLQDFFEAIAGHRPAGPFTITREQFDQKCPALYHRVTETDENSWTQSHNA